MDPRLFGILRLILEHKDKIRITNVHYERYGDMLIVYLEFENSNQAQYAELILEEIIKQFKGDANE